jgi:light-regulated signal transduction histidine kinase (bacteriophytochrome)
MNYFYVRKQLDGWKVFWLDRNKLNNLASSVRVTGVKYPNKNSKQISIYAESNGQKYLIEIRNSKSGEYPNDIKFKVIP